MFLPLHIEHPEVFGQRVLDCDSCVSQIIKYYDNQILRLYSECKRESLVLLSLHSLCRLRN